jgi:cell division protein FtsW
MERGTNVPRRLENDRWLFGVTLALCLFGAVMVFSASAVTAEQHYGRSYFFLLRQAAWLVIGLFGMFALMRLDYRRLREPAVVYTTVCAVLLLLVGAFFLDKSHATHRWIKFGPLGIQPSELAKLAVILYLAWFLDLKRRNAAKMEFCREDFIQTILPAVMPILLCVGVILLQPDLGTAVDIVVIATAVLFVAGLSWKWLVCGVVGALPILYLLISHVSYRQARLMAFLNPASDPQGSGFQLLQSLIAVGSGGFSGVGLMESKQKLFFLPEAHTDFI